MEREIPVLYKRKEECCGCTACYAICPKEAISMVEDEEGFEYLPESTHWELEKGGMYYTVRNQSSVCVVISALKCVR